MPLQTKAPNRKPGTMNARPGYMQTRSLEAGLAMVMMVVGFQLWRSGDTFSAPSYYVLRRWMGEEAGGLILMIVGALRFVALIVNSHVKESPIARLAGCLVGFSFWTLFSYAVTVGADEAGLINPILPCVAMVMAAKEFYSGVRTGMDASTLDSLRLQERRARRRDNRA